MIDWLDLLAAAVIAFGIVGMFLGSMAEAAMLGVSSSTLRRLSEARDRRSLRLARLMNQGNYLSTILVGINTFLVLISTAMTLLVERHLPEGSPQWVSEALHIGLVLFIMVFAELTPKTYGGLYPEPTALRMARPVAVLTRLFGPLVAVLTSISRPFVGHRTGDRHDRQLLTVEEIRMAADVSEEEGLVEPEEAEMLDSVIDLSQTMAREVMVPRVSMVAVDEHASIAEFAAVVTQTGLSRIPIFHETLDQVTGIVYVKDVLQRLSQGERDFPLPEIARPPLFYPETKRVGDLLRELREQHVHIGIVVDEFGGTAGLITIEDILEELVGDIEDEHDRPETAITRISDREILADGKVRIDDVNQELGTGLPEDQHETIGGLVSGLAGRIPAAGEVFSSRNVRLAVEASDGQHVERVRITVQAPAELER